MPSRPLGKSIDPDDVGLTIDGKQYFFWDNIDLQFSMDNHPTVGFTVPFEPENADFRKTFAPLSKTPVDITIGGAKAFTGTLFGVPPNVGPDARIVDVTAYSRPAVLCHSDAPASLLPTEFHKLNLQQIASQLCAPFGFGVEARGISQVPFPKARIGVDDKIQSFLVGLAQQRASLVSSTADGKLLLWTPTATGAPVARLEEGVPPIGRVEPTFNPDEYYSEITGYVPAKRGKKGSFYTEKNPHLSGSNALCACAFKLDDIEKGDAPAAVKAKMGRMFANVLSVSLDIPGWRDPKGNLWQPNTTLSLKAPSAMIYSPYEFLIRDVRLHQDAGVKVTTLGLVMPGVFSGEIPKTLPWEA